MPSRVRLGMRFFTLTVLLAIPCRTKADEALEQLKDGLRQSRESITSLVAEYEMGRESTSPDRNNPPKTLGDALQRVKWAQVGNVARWTFSSNFGSMHHEFLWKNEELSRAISHPATSYRVSVWRARSKGRGSTVSSSRPRRRTSGSMSR